MPLLSADRLDLITLFLRVAEKGQISLAARELGLSQPSASRHLVRLEGLLGVKLVDRSSQGLSLTQAGRDFLGPARRLVDDWHEAASLAKEGGTSLSGTIRVAVPIAVGGNFLAVIAARFIRKHPQIAIEWHLRDDALDMAASGYDLWIHAGDVLREDLVVKWIYRVERAVMAAEGAPSLSHPKELQGQAAVRLSTFVPATVELRNGENEAFRLRQNSRFTTDNLYAARAAVLEGVGYGVLPLWCVQEELARGIVTRPCPEWRPPDITLSIACIPSRARSPSISALLAYLQSELLEDHGVGVTFIRTVGATDSVQRMPTPPSGGTHASRQKS